MLKKNYFKKTLSLLMAIIMIITVVPYGTITAFADGETIKGAVETVYRSGGDSSSKREAKINQNWMFNMTTADCSATTYNDSAWSNVSLPHDFSIYQNFTTSGEAESGFLPGGTGWYRKKLVIPANQNGKRFELNFDGSYMHTYVYVNGSYVGENHYGYNSFAFDITDKLICDGSTENVIAVKVVHNTPSSRWYSGSGIYRNVTLITTDPVHVAHNGLTITTPNISSSNGTVNAVAKVQNDSASSASVSVKASIYEKGSDSAVATATSNANVNANSTSNVTITPVVTNPKLWSLDNPNLYVAKIEVSVGGTVVDTYEDTFGFRYFGWSRTNGFSLNGQRVQLNGVCMHHDQGALGSAAYYDAMYRQMESMKNMGVNAIRATHNPYSEDFYKICDELGLLVIEELFDGWAWAKNGNSNDFSSQWNVNLTSNNTVIGGSTSMTWPEFVTKEVCQRDVNRPSVFMWSICNELFEGANGGVSTAETYAQNIINWIKSVDTTRKYTAGDNNIKNGNSYYIAVDRVIANNGGIVGLNYCNTTQYSSIYNNNSSWIFYGAETASTTNSRDMYKSLSSNSAADSNRHITSYDTSAVGWGKTANDSMYTTLSNTFLAGEFRWTGWDYIGEPTPWNGTGTGQVSGGNGATPNSSYFGVVDTAGFEKDTYYLYRSQWGDKVGTTTHLVTAWDSDNYYVSGGKTPVFIYSNAAKVELYLRKNGSNTDTLMGTATRKDSTTSVGAKYHQYNTTSNNSSECTATALNNSSGTSLYARFDLTYTKGTLFTKSYDSNGNLINASNIQGRQTVTTPDNVRKITMTKDKEEIAADGSSLAYFTVDLTDANGNRDTMSSKLIKFDIIGDGEIMGCDNGDQATTQKYQQSSVLNVNDRTTAQIYGYAGKALCIVRSTNDAGSFTLTASSPSSEFASVSETVNTLAVDDGAELQTGEINSYSYIRNYTVKVGTPPTFDTTATATVVGSAEKINGTITWNSVDSSKYNKVGDYTIKGKANFDSKGSLPVSCTLHVVEGIAGVQNISLQAMKGSAPQLPDVVNGLTATGEVAGQFPVVWDPVSDSQFANVGDIVEVSGNATDFDGSNLPVKSFVRVVNPNVEESSDITNTAYITSDVATGLNALRDGDITTKAWTNETNATNSDKAYIDFRWDTAVSLSSLDIAYNIDGKACQPEDVEIQYSMDNVDYETVGYTSPLAVEANKLQHYALDETINPIAVRIIFTQQKRTTGDCCVAVNEVKLNSETKSLPEANDNAELSSILVNDVAIDGFASSKLNYTNVVLEESDVVTATANDNVAITVLPQVDNKVKIVTLSENGEESKVYSVGKVVVPVVITNIATNSTVTGSHSLSTSYNVLKDGRAGYDGNNSSYSENGVSGLNNLNSWGWRSTNTAPFDVNFAFDKVYDVSQIKAYFWCDSGGTKAPSKFEIQVSTDGTSFETVNTFTERSSNSTPENNMLPPLSNSSRVTPCTFDVDIKGAKAIKVIAYQTGTDAVGYAEVEIMGSEHTDSNTSETLNEVKYTFSGANTTFDGNNTPYLFTDNTNNTYLTGAQWGSTSSSNSNGYINVDNATITSVKASNKVTSGDAISDVTGEHWSISMKYQYNYNDNASVTLFGIGSHNSVSTQSNGQTQDSSYMPNGRFGADLIYVCKDGGVYVNGSSSSSATISGVQSSNAQTITFKYESGTIKVLIDDAEKASIDVSSNKDKFEAGPGNFFVGTSVANLAGGTWHYIGRSNTANAIHSFKLYEIKAIKTTIEEVTPVEPVDPEEPEETEEYVADTIAIDAAMSAFETKVGSGKIYKNIYNAYRAYVECKKARDAAKYGHDESIDLAAKAQALTTATNALTEWTMSMPTDVSKVSARFSSYDNATSNKQYFKNALYITQSDDPVVANANPGHAWFGVYYHNGTYIYDGTNAIEVPVMLMTIPYKNPFYFFSAYLTGQNSAVSLKGRWFGSDGPGSGQARKYYYYHDEASLQSMSSDYYSRRFSFPSTSSYNNNSTFNDSKIGDLSGKSNWNLATTNTFVINGATLFPSGSKTVSTDVSMGTINMHTYNSTSLSSPWKNTYSLGTQVKVINQKGLKDRVSTYTEKFKNVSNYSEGGLNWAADGINRFANLDYNITNQAASTLTADMTTAHNSFNSADSSTPVDSTAYANLRTALDSATATTNNNCYDNDKFEAYKTARSNAIKAMKDVATNGYVGTNISDLATKLNNARTAMETSERAHDYSNGVYNPSTNEITYTCNANNANASHNLVVDAGTYNAAVEELKADLEEEKFKDQAVKNCQADIAENGYFGLINDNSVSKIVTQAEMDNIIAAITTLKTELNERVNIKRFDVTYAYVKNGNIIREGTVVDARYGDWLKNSEYTLGAGESVYKWTVTSNGETVKTSNKNTAFDILAIKDMELACYVTDETETVPENSCKATFINKSAKISGIEVLEKNTTLTVDGDCIKMNGDVIFKASKLPFYQVIGFKVGSQTYETGTFTVTKDVVIQPVYQAGAPIKIYFTGSDAGSALINGESNHNGEPFAYNAKWDERIVLDSNNPNAVYWFINGKLVGYGTQYAFRATVDSNVTISSSATDASPKAYVDYFNYDVELNKVTAVVSFYTAGNVAQSAGVILSTSATTKDEILAKGKKFSSTVFTGDKNQTRITVSRTVNTEFNMYAVPYVTINGEDHYGDTVAVINYKP